MGALKPGPGTEPAEIAAAVERLQKAGNELRQWGPKMLEFAEELRKLGFRLFVGGMALAPFDAIFG